MKLTNEIWAFIPARFGSKRVVHKNIKKINNIPLLAHSVIFALKVKKISKIIVSSDSKKYLNVAKKYGASELHLRKKKFSKDETPDIDVFYDYTRDLIKKNKDVPKYFLHLRPSTPFRNVRTCNMIINFFQKNKKKYTALRSVSSMTNPSYKTMRIVNQKLCSIIKKDFSMDKLNKPGNSFPKTFIPNGQYDIVKTENILKKILHGNKVFGFISKEFNSDIDDANDFLKVKKFYSSNF